MTIKRIVLLWYETQMGNIYKCKEKKAEFADIMWELYEQYKEENND